VQLSLTNCSRCWRFYPIFPAVPNGIRALALLVGFQSSQVANTMVIMSIYLLLFCNLTVGAEPPGGIDSPRLLKISTADPANLARPLDSLVGSSEWLGYLTTHYGRRPFTASKNNASNRSRSAFIATRMMIPLSLSSVRPLSAPSSSTTIKDIS
jgi:hypothetical protein